MSCFVLCYVMLPVLTDVHEMGHFLYILFQDVKASWVLPACIRLKLLPANLWLFTPEWNLVVQLVGQRSSQCPTFEQTMINVPLWRNI